MDIKASFFSIITCTYNSEKYLKETIDSVCSQKYRDFEHIFIDAGSKDRTLEIIEDYRKEFPLQVQVFQQEPSGISNAMNCGVEKATGEIICHLHSDDLFYDENVLTIAEKTFSEFPDLKWCYGKMIIINLDGSEYNREDPPEFSFQKLMSKNFIPHPATFIRKDFFIKLGGFKNYKYAMDYDLWLRASKESIPLKIDYFISKFRRHGESLSTKEYVKTLNEDYAIRRVLKRNFAERVMDYFNFKKNVLLYKLFLIKEKLL